MKLEISFFETAWERLKETSLAKEMEKRKELFLALFLVAFFFLNTTFVFAEGTREASGSQSALSPQTAFQALLEALGKSQSPPPTFNSPRGRIARRILTLPFRDDVVYEVLLGYGITIELELPHEVKDLVPPDEHLVSADFLGNKAYLKGIAYAVGESTNVHVNTLTGTTLHLKVKIVEPEESDHAFKFVIPSKEVFTPSYVKKEIQKEKEKLEAEIGKREENLEKVTDELAEEKIKAKLMREEKLKERRKKLKARDLEIRDLEVSRIGERVYVKFSLKNKSERDFSVGEIILARGIPDPKDSGKILGLETLAIDPPTLESGTVPAGESVKVLLAFDRRILGARDQVTLKVIEAGSPGRVLEFKEVSFFSR